MKQEKDRSAIVSNKINRKKIIAPYNAKEKYQSYLKRKKHIICETSKNNYSATKIDRKPKHYCLNSVTLDDPKTSHKLTKIIRQVEGFLKQLYLVEIFRAI